MGCGNNKLSGYLNVDASAACQPDKVWDLEKTPWPWKHGSAEEVVFNHSLEHMGDRSKTFLGIMKELYRLMAPGGRVVIRVPHPRHDNFMNDPTHVRPITAPLLMLFDRQKNHEWRMGGYSNTPLGDYLGVDFRIVEYEEVLAEPYLARRKAGQLADGDLAELVRERNNVIEELRIVLQAAKPL